MRIRAIISKFTTNRRPPFMLWTAPELQHVFTRKSKNAIECTPPLCPEGYAIYLWPDSLRWYFLIFGLVISLPFAFYSKLYLISVLMFLSIAVFFPFILFYCFRLRLSFNDVWHVWPKYLCEWFRGIPARGPGSYSVRQNIGIKSCLKSKSNFVDYFARLSDRNWLFRVLAAIVNSLPIDFFLGRNSMSNWKMEGSPQESYLKAAIAQFFLSNRNKNPFCDRALLMWLLWWASPVWISYLVMFFIPIIYTKKMQANFGITTTLDTQVFMRISLIWSLIAMVFFIREGMRFKKWISLDRKDNLYLLPVKVRSVIEDIDLENQLLKQWDLKIIFGIVYTVSITAYWMFLKIFY